jgi:hypothetical protein
MEVLSSRKRNIYFGVLTLIFLVAAPAVALYATGYRLSSNFEIIKTGGIHVAVPTSGATFYLDDEFAGNGTIFQRSFFTQNLAPGIYTVRIEKEGYHPWRKQLEVFPTFISEARALLLVKDPELTPIPETLSDIGIGTTTANTRYREILGAFSATSTGLRGAPLGATTTVAYLGATTTVYDRDGVGIWLDDSGLHALWLRKAEDYPYVFCAFTECTPEILVWGRSSEIRHFDFLPSDNLFVLLERPDGIVVAELDTRVPQNVQPLYLSEGAQFRVIGNVLYILDGKQLFEVKI